jgi:methionyl aminopeptidase
METVETETEPVRMVIEAEAKDTEVKEARTEVVYKLKSPTMCNSVGCYEEASMQCPTCQKSNLPPARFCKQECFKASWGFHKMVHEVAKQDAQFTPPSFKYTGGLRPHFVTPQQSTPPEIPRPEYALTGQPVSESSQRGNATIHVCTKKEIRGIRAACKLGREILDLAHSLVRPGITTDEIDRVVHAAIIARGAYPSPLNYHNFPKSLCTSVNEVICHGIPDARPLEDGDIVNLDVTVYYKGYHGDLNETYCVGNVEPKHKKLIEVTYNALQEAIQQVKPGAMCREFGDLISRSTGKAGFSVVRAYCGHGIGSLFHSTPSIPHYGKNKAIGVLKPGMVFTIEPMINEGGWQDETWPDEWTSVTRDGKRSAQFEHTLLVTETGVEILTARFPTSPPLHWDAPILPNS